MKILLLDIDHTISDAAWRDDMLASRDWDAYHLAGKEDKAVEEVVALVDSLSADPNEAWEIICLTARPGKWRQQTMQWMVKYNCPVDELLMRPDDSYQSAGELKTELLKMRFGSKLEGLQGHDVILIDDNDKVIEAMRALNITTMQISVAKRRT